MAPIGDSAIVDSHVHLFEEQQLHRLAWMDADSPLNCGHGADEYVAEGGHSGAIYVETDRKCSDELRVGGWENVLEEARYVHGLVKSRTIRGGVLWAPIPGGPEVLEQYLVELYQTVASQPNSWLKGFRYLLQDKPEGTMLTPQFRAGISWLGDHGFTFDLGIDVRGSGIWQLQEAVELVAACPHTTFIIDHMAKPDLSTPVDSLERDDHFKQWSTYMQQLSKHRTFVKLSGAFSEIDKSLVGQCAEQLLPWFKVLLDHFEPSRILWGSDWPVCKLQGGPNAISHWQKVCQALFDECCLSREQTEHIWSRTAVTAYNL